MVYLLTCKVCAIYNLNESANIWISEHFQFQMCLRNGLQSINTCIMYIVYMHTIKYKNPVLNCFHNWYDISWKTSLLAPNSLLDTYFLLTLIKIMKIKLLYSLYIETNSALQTWKIGKTERKSTQLIESHIPDTLIIIFSRFFKRHKWIYVMIKDRAERHDLKSRFLLFILLFSSLFLGGKRKGEKNNQSRDFKSCLSARSWKKQ